MGLPRSARRLVAVVAATVAATAILLSRASGPSFSLVPGAPPRARVWPLQLAAPEGSARQVFFVQEEDAKGQGLRTSVLTASFLAAGGLLLLRRAASSTLRPSKGGVAAAAAGGRQAVVLHALPEAADAAQAAQEAHRAAELWLAAGGPEQIVDMLQSWMDGVAAAGQGAFDLWPAAYAEEVTQAVPALIAKALPVLDPNQQYLIGVDGVVLVDPMNNQALKDDWWNGFIGFQSNIIKDIDEQLRLAGVEQAFGWTIVLYTLLVKLLFYPLQQSQLRSTSMMQLLAPKVKEIQERYKDDPESQQRLMGQLYAVMDVNPLGGCLPVFLQLPVFWSLYGVWRRLYAERFPHYEEPWLWVPSLAQPNPDFQFKFDWLMKFKDGAPEMGWHDYVCYLIFPCILVGFTIFQQQQAQTAKPKEGKEDEAQALILKFLPLVSVYFIGTLSLELPQAVSVYYTVNTALTLAQTALVKNGLRGEIPGYEEFEKTGKFPDGAFEDALTANAPMPKTLHEAALRGNTKALTTLLDEEGLDIDAWDEKDICPIGYAVATGNVASVSLLIARGANIEKRDGQDNSLLHYAAGYGHLPVLEELLKAQPDKEWTEWRNKKGQTVMDAARVNRKGSISDFLCEYLGLEPEARTDPANSQARAALLAAAGGADFPAAQAAASSGAEAVAAAASPDAAKAAEAMRTAVSKLKENPEAVEQARQMMAKMPPQMLSMLSGNKLSAEQAQKAMDTMSKMDTSDILEKAEGAAAMMSGAEVKPGDIVDVIDTSPVEKEKSSVPARAVD